MTKQSSQTIDGRRLYDYSDRLVREEGIRFLLSYASREKAGISSYWRRMRDYYDGVHDTTRSLSEMLGGMDIPFVPAQSTDGFIHVESQIDTSVPSFEFVGRGKGDSEKAFQRGKIVDYIASRSPMERMNSENERRLGVLGSAVWKVSWDGRRDGVGEVEVSNPHPSQLFADPSATQTDDCEYIAYCYTLHTSRASRLFGADIRRAGYTPEEVFRVRGAWSDVFSSGFLAGIQDYDDAQHSVNVTEWWFRQPEDGEERIKTESGEVSYRWKSGDVGLCLLINGREVRYVPKYWNSVDCDMYPFVIYRKTPNEGSIWGKSELEAIVPLIDAADRELAFAQLNSAFMSNDIIIAEENAFSDDSAPENRPGAVWKLRPGMMGKVQRLGNIAYSENALQNNTERWRSLMQQTTGNFDTYQGAEPSRVLTATGIALLNERSRSRLERKRVDRQAGFERLYKLMDYSALENYDDGRVIHIGATDGSFVYKYNKVASEDGYIPRVDVKINVGDGLKNSKAFTISALSDLIRTPVNADNYALVKAFVELIDIPQSADICRQLEEKYSGGARSDTPQDGQVPQTADITSETEVVA